MLTSELTSVTVPMYTPLSALHRQAFSALDIATQTLVAAYKGQHLHARAFEVGRHTVSC